MVTIDTFRKLALSLPEAIEEPYFEKSSFIVRKKIFATYDKTRNLATLKFSDSDQDFYSLADESAIYPVDNKSGKQGWTIVELAKVKEDLFTEMLVAAYCQVAPKELVDQIKLTDFE